MLWAMNGNTREMAQPKGRAICPCCNSKVIAKCGQIVTWHWAHEVDDCDPWYECESEWHISWKRRFPNEWQEVVVGNHRADIKTPLCVVELQNSSISTEDIKEREWHYKKMVWLLNGDKFFENIDITERSDHVTFRWKWPRKTWWYASKPIFIDLPGRPYMLWIKRMYQDPPYNGWGKRVTYNRFIDLVTIPPFKEAGLLYNYANQAT